MIGKKQKFLAKSIDFQNNYVYLQPASRLIPYWECEGCNYLHSLMGLGRDWRALKSATTKRAVR